MMLAATQGDLRQVTHLLGMADEVDSAGRTGLHLAATHGHDEIVAQLLTRTSDPNMRDGRGWTALHYAAFEGHHKVVKCLLAAGVQVNDERPELSALHCAASEGHELVVAALLADPRTEVKATQSNQFKNALHLAAYGGHEGVVGQLLADPRTPVNDGRLTALHWAAGEGHHKVVERLLADKRTEINAKDIDGYTALFKAVESGNGEVVAVLLSQDPLPTENGKSLFEAIISKEEEISSLLITKFPVSEIVQWVYQTGNVGYNAFHVAVNSRQDKTAAQLLALSPSLIDGPTIGNRNTLHTAVSFGSELLIDVLLAAKPEWVSIVEPHSGDTLLHFAVRSSPRLSPSYFTKLWELTSPNDAMRTANKRGKTPFTLAITQNYKFAIESMQWKLSIDEIVNAASHTKKASFDRLLAVIGQELACLLHVLNQDVMSIVYAYVLFNGAKPPPPPPPPPSRRRRRSSPQPERNTTRRNRRRQETYLVPI